MSLLAVFESEVLETRRYYVLTHLAIVLCLCASVIKRTQRPD